MNKQLLKLKYRVLIRICFPFCPLQSEDEGAYRQCVKNKLSPVPEYFPSSAWLPLKKPRGLICTLPLSLSNERTAFLADWGQKEGSSRETWRHSKKRQWLLLRWSYCLLNVLLQCCPKLSPKTIFSTYLLLSSLHLGAATLVSNADLSSYKLQWTDFLHRCNIWANRCCLEIISNWRNALGVGWL